jgi:hypothetical protein
MRKKEASVATADAVSLAFASAWKNIELIY